MANKEEVIYMTAKPETIQGLDDEYVNMISRSQDEMQEKGFEAVFKKNSSRALNSNDEWVYDLPHPVRKQWAGIMPLHVELMIQEQQAVTAMMDMLAEREIDIGHFVKRMLYESDSLKKLAMEGNMHLSSSNLGALDPTIHPHVYYAKGSRMFKLEDRLTEMLNKTDLGMKTPSGFVAPPYSNIFLHAAPDFTIYNAQSGDHPVDGFYINSYVIPDEAFTHLFRELTSIGLFQHLAEKGLLTEAGGDVRVFELLAVGRPKRNVVDDASFSFTIAFQDPARSVQEVVDEHCYYYGNKVANCNRNVLEGINFENADELHQKQLKNCVEFVVKALLYINSEDSTRSKVMELSDLKMKMHGLKNPAKKRKLQRKLDHACDYTLIGFKGEYESTGGPGTGTKSTHWRRGHFREQRYGENRSKSKMIMIQPTIVGKGKPTTKEYKVK